PHNLRTRRIGNLVAVEVHIRLDGNLTLAEAHERTSQIEKRLKERFGSDSHITIHMEPVKNS
ncbi:MAG: cation-efflux pump, partial [Bacteroidales bacterium]|nr:cation-efflux pump [Bacteroidales bacterium]